MNEATALAQAKQPTASDRWGEARHADYRLLCREVHDLETIQPLECLDGNSRLHTDTRGETRKIDGNAAWMLFNHPAKPSSQKRRRWPKVLRPHLLDVPVAQSPPIIGLSRNRNYVQRDGI
jgi:hypothetical protein